MTTGTHVEGRGRILVAAVCAAAAVLGAGVILFGPLPPLDAARGRSPVITDRNGIVLYEPLSPLGSRGEWLREVPPNVAQSTLAAEDHRFESHFGIDPRAIARAAVHDLRRGAFVEGGSTITQQVAKMLLARGSSPPRGTFRRISRKAHETVVALRLERHYSKRAILQLYVNLAPYGNRIHGVARASRQYFGCGPEDLTVAQSAFLAALPQRPSAFNPLRDPTRAAARQQHVLRRLRQLGMIDHFRYDEARAERLHFDRRGEPLGAQHFVERVLDSLGDAADAAIIRTTLDARLQRAVQGIIAARREQLLAHGAGSVAVAVLDNATGEWLAWEGSGDYFGSSFGGAIDGVVALRQPGSTLKPFTYAVAFEQGLSPATVLADVPSSFPTAEEGVVYTPRNYDGRYRGPLRARLALAGSENVPAVALLSHTGPAALLRLLRNAGFSDLEKTADYYGLGLTLGDAEVRLAQLVAGYAVFARGGVGIEPRLIAGVPPAQARRLLSPRTAFWITDVLSDPQAREFIFGSGGSLDFPFPVAVKTGTSQAYRDNWTIGYTRDVTVGVWVGNFDRRELRDSTGVTGAAPIFHDVMLIAARAGGRVIAGPPNTVERAPVCALSGLRPSTRCPAVEPEWVAAEAPVEFCSWHQAEGVAWPDEYRGWANDEGLLRTVSRAAASQAPAARAVRIVSPADGATYLIDPTLRKAYQAVSLRAVSRRALVWRVDARSVGRSSASGKLNWPLEPGRHTITAVDETGGRDSVRIVVR